MAKQKINLGRNWYAVHVVNGFEEVVAESILKRAKDFDMEDKIFNALVPKEKKVKIRKNKKEIVEEKMYPGYVLVDMIVTDESWYLIRNTPNVTGFVGTGTTPIPIEKAEIEEIFKRMKQEPVIEFDFQINDMVKIIEGPLKDFEGKIVDIDQSKGKLKILVNIFNRETPVEVNIYQVKKI